MAVLRKVTIRFRLVISFIFLILVFSGFGFASFLSVGSMQGNAEEIYKTRLISVEKLLNADRDAYQSNLALSYLVRYLEKGGTDSGTIAGYISDIRENRAQVEERFGAFEELFRTDSVKEYYTEDTWNALKLFPFGIADLGNKIKTFHDSQDKWKKVTDDIADMLEKSVNSVGKADELFHSSLYQENFAILRSEMNDFTDVSLLIAEQEYKTLLKRENNVRRIYILQFIVMLSAFILILVFLFRSVMKPISRVGDAMNELSKGGGDLTIRLPVRSGDEIGNLSGFFNRFMDHLTLIIRSLSETAGKNDSIKSKLALSTQETSSAITEISANINSINDQITLLDSTAGNTSETVNRFTETLKSLDLQIETQASMVEESTSAITQMIAALKSVTEITEKKKSSTKALVETMKTGGEKLRFTVNVVEKINNYIDSIRGLTEVINSIAKKTNLLAMNAAIEAAHAGKSGKGFAVVADEIKKLAETSGIQSKKITGVVEEILSEVKLAAEGTKETTAAFSKIEKEVNEVNLALEEIVNAITEMDQGGSQILSAMSNLRNTTLTIKNNAAGIRDFSADVKESSDKTNQISGIVSKGMGEITRGNTEIGKGMALLSSISGNIEQIGEILSGEVSKFRISKEKNGLKESEDNDRDIL